MIEIESLNFTYPRSGKQAVRNMSFNIREGEVFGFLGPSGAGKTTTQRLLIGLLRNYEGSIRVFGRERSEWGKEYYEKIGVAFDFPNLYLKLTARENLQRIASYYRKNPGNIDEWIDRVGLTADRDVRVENFSKGMKMRLNFVRSLLHDPSLLFFDEPTSGLDPSNAQIIKDIVMEQKQRNKTIFLTTHNMTVAEQLCDRVAFVVDGQIVVTGAPKELMIEHGKREVKVTTACDTGLEESVFKLDELADNPEFLRMLRNRQVKSIHTCDATLEEIFIQLTGRALLCE